MNELLLNLGLNIGANAIYDFFKTSLTDNKLTRGQLTEKLAAQLDITNAKIVAEKIIEFAAKNGDINISGTYIFSSDSINMKSANGTKFTFGNDSISKTPNSEISAGMGASIVGTGGAQIRQDSNGDIIFSV